MNINTIFAKLLTSRLHLHHRVPQISLQALKSPMHPDGAWIHIMYFFPNSSESKPVAGEAVLVPLPDALPLVRPDRLEGQEAHCHPRRPLGPQPGGQVSYS